MARADYSRAAHLCRLEDRIGSVTRGYPGLQYVRVGRHRIDLGTAYTVVEAEMTERKMLDFICRARAMTDSLDIARIQVVGINRTVREVPHYLGSDFWIADIDERKRQPSY